MKSVSKMILAVFTLCLLLVSQQTNASAHVAKTPDWIAALPAAQNAKQVFVVAGVGETTAWISLHEKDAQGNWRQLMTTPGFIGKNGLGKEKEGDSKTPVGVFGFNKAFGIAPDPGCAIPYVQVNEETYWSGDVNPGMKYNRMVELKDYPNLDTKNSEHIVDYDVHYQYCLNISYNAAGVPGLGSAIFVHCLAPQKPFTGGCVALPKDKMVYLMKHVRPDCVVIIDSLENLGGSF